MISMEKLTTVASQNMPNQPCWHEHAFRAMNTDVYLWLYSRNGALARYVEQHFARFERSLSRFDRQSELARLNRCPQAECSLSAELYAALEVAYWAAQATQGIYDPALLPALVQAGYDRSFELIEEKASYQVAPAITEACQVQTARPSPYTFRDIHLDRLRRMIRRPPGLQIDLGGMGKGWTVDRAADLLYQEGPFFINAGGDIYAHGFPGNRKGWEIELTNPLAPEQWLARLYLANQALATSTMTKRRWKKHGQLMHHLIDPRTGQPAKTDALSVTVIAERTVLADVYAKVILILGVQAGLAYLQKLPNVEGLIYTSADQIVCTAGFVALLDTVAAGVTVQVAENDLLIN